MGWLKAAAGPSFRSRCRSPSTHPNL
ncbi:hypothetical protein SO694_0014100 [Aureococcus anophagefferens]|uniref:Uncharacterized protein n=1 Tax=Aureococcus anophagefferens TaxID=44056 RepID=A0ABR1FPC5_AURAN